MPIRRRISKIARLPYHALFGSLENPPLKFQRGWGGQPWPPEGVLGVRIVGLICGTKHKYFPPKLKIDVDNVIIGLLYNHRTGVGPDQGFSTWVATKVIERTRAGMFFPETYNEVNLTTGKRKQMTANELLSCWKFCARCEPKSGFYHTDTTPFRHSVESQLEEDAYDAIYLDYEDIHEISFPWNLMRYRKPKQRSV